MGRMRPTTSPLTADGPRSWRGPVGSAAAVIEPGWASMGSAGLSLPRRSSRLAGPESGVTPSRLRVLRRRGAPSGRIARGEATPDVSHLEAHFVRSREAIQKRAPIGVGGEPGAGDGARKVEHEPVVLELRHQCLELRHGHAKSLVPFDTEGGADGRGEQAPPLHRRRPRGVRLDLVDRIRVVLSRELVDEVPATPRRDQAAHAHEEAAEEEGKGEAWLDTSRHERRGDGGCPEREIAPLLPSKLTEA